MTGMKTKCLRYADIYYKTAVAITLPKTVGLRGMSQQASTEVTIILINIKPYI